MQVPKVFTTFKEGLLYTGVYCLGGFFSAHHWGSNTTFAKSEASTTEHLCWFIYWGGVHPTMYLLISFCLIFKWYECFVFVMAGIRGREGHWGSLWWSSQIKEEEEKEEENWRGRCIWGSGKEYKSIKPFYIKCSIYVYIFTSDECLHFSCFGNVIAFVWL